MSLGLLVGDFATGCGCCTAALGGRLTAPQAATPTLTLGGVAPPSCCHKERTWLGDPAADRRVLAEVINLGLLWHCLCAITRLEVPERLAAGPLPKAQLAAAVGADQDALWRALRLVADHHIGTFEGDRVGLTDRAGCRAETIQPRCRPPSPRSGPPTSPMGLTDTRRTGRSARCR